MATAQVGESSNGRRVYWICLSLFPTTRSTGWKEVIRIYLELVVFTGKGCHMGRLRIIMVFFYTPSESLLTASYSVLCLVLRNDPWCNTLAHPWL